MNKCPFCAEEIQDEAIKCKHCGEWLAKDFTESEKKEQPQLQPEDTAPAESSIRRAVLSLQISDIRKADKAIKSAWIAGIVCAVITVILTFSSISNVIGLNESSFVSAIFVFGLSFGIYKKNRACAVILFTYFIGEKLLQIYDANPFISSRTIVIQGIMFGYLFFQGIRGTFAYHKLKSPAKTAITEKGEKPLVFSKSRNYHPKPEVELPIGKDIISDKTVIDNTSAVAKDIIIVFGPIAAFIIIIGILIAFSNQSIEFSTKSATAPQATATAEDIAKKYGIGRYAPGAPGAPSGLPKIDTPESILQEYGIGKPVPGLPPVATPESLLEEYGIGKPVPGLPPLPTPEDILKKYNIGKPGGVGLPPLPTPSAEEIAGNYQQAITEFNKLIELNPLDHGAYNNRGEAHLRLGNYQQAKEDFNRAIISFQQSGDKFESDIGNTLAKHGVVTNSFTDLIQKEAYYFRNRGLAYEKLGNKQQAIDDMKTAAKAGDKEAQKYLLSKEMAW